MRIVIYIGLSSLLGQGLGWTKSLSIGTVYKGRLVRGRKMALSGPHHYILPRRHAKRGINWGTDELIALLREVARKVHEKFPGAKLGIGNISPRHGGWMRYSRSHRSGRNADLAFYALGRDSRYRKLVDLMRFNRKGLSRHGFKFDISRNWALIRAMLNSKKAHVQHLYIYPPLAKSMLNHADAIGEPQWICHRAKYVLRPAPQWSRLHNDHFHLRIYCSVEDLKNGCIDQGEIWPWVQDAREKDKRTTSVLTKSGKNPNQ